MRAAIYARKSTEDTDRNEENKSVTRQIERAREYVLKRGWTVLEENVYVDDGISGAEYNNRPGLARLMASIPKRGLPPFEVLVMSESSRLGRDMVRNAAYVVDILDSGVRIYYYLTDEEELAETPEQRVMLTLKSYASEVERLKAGQRSRDALARKAENGYNAGGVVYGYDNKQVFATVNGQQVKSHTDYEINEQEAEVLLNMFRMYAAGYGHVTIAKTLNGDPRYKELSERYFNGKKPTPPRKGTGSWAPSSVRAMLYNERYTGIVPFGEHRKVYRKGTKARVRQADNAILRAQRPDLRIISDDLWREVQARLASVKRIYLRDTKGHLWGRPGSGVESKYLLTGLSSCGYCGRSITMLGGRTRFYYGCSYHQNRGRTVCANDYRADMKEADALVLERARHLLTPEAVDYTIDRALKALADMQRKDLDRPARIEAELRLERGKRDNLLAAIENGKAPASILQRIKTLESSIAEKERELQTFVIKQPTHVQLRQIREALRQRLGQFQDMMLSEVSLARQALRKILVGRIQFAPENRNDAPVYHLTWNWAIKGLVQGELLDQEGYIGVASPRRPELIPGLRFWSELKVA